MDKHRFNIFPEIIGEDYEVLKESISKGYDKTMPIVTYQNAIIDGWNRFKICKEINVIPTYKEFIGNDVEAINYIMRTNKRRNLSSSQWAIIAVESEDIVKAIEESVEAERRKKISEQQTKSNSKSKSFQKVVLIPPSETKKEENKARTIIAKTFNTNPRYISDAKKLKEENPEKFKQVKSGEKSITEVKKEIKKEKFIAKVEKQKTEIKTKPKPTIDGNFDVIVLDPPWNYGREYDPENSRVANPYPEMTQQELKDLKIQANDNSVMWLWTTHAFIQDAFELIDHWGFTYKAILTWNKEKIGMGHWLRMQTEFCLLAIKGKPVWDNTTYRDIIIEKRREHSRKPEAFYNMVNEICYGSKLEYFAREQRKGFSVFGNDTNKF